MKRFCPNCHAPAESAGERCDRCGKPLPFRKQTPPSLEQALQLTASEGAALRAGLEAIALPHIQAAVGNYQDDTMRKLDELIRGRWKEMQREGGTQEALTDELKKAFQDSFSSGKIRLGSKTVDFLPTAMPSGISYDHAEMIKKALSAKPVAAGSGCCVVAFALAASLWCLAAGVALILRV